MRLEGSKQTTTWFRQLGALALILALCLPAWWPMLSQSFWTSHDGLHHIFRIAEFDAGVRAGSLYPRWAADLGFGYGFPVTHYYAPLAYALAELVHIAGAGILDSIKLADVVAFGAGALGMYYLAHRTLSQGAALLASMVYAYYPY